MYDKISALLHMENYLGIDKSLKIQFFKKTVDDYFNIVNC